MSKYKNINLIPYSKNGNSLFALINQFGEKDYYFDYFVNNLVSRGFTKNTVQSYSYGIATFVDYLVEYTIYLDEKGEIINGFKLRDIISNFKSFLSGAIYSSNKEIKDIAFRLNAKALSPATEESYIAAVNQFLLLSEEFRVRMIELGEYNNFGFVDENKIFPWTGLNKELSKQASFKISSKNVLASVISGGMKFKQIASITATKRRQEKPIDDKKEFPIEKVYEQINSHKTLMDKTLIALLASTGLRTSEALLLTLNDIDIENEEIKVRDPKQRHVSDYLNYFSFEEKNELPFKTRSTEDVFLIKPFDDLFWYYLGKYIKGERKPSSKHNFLFTKEDGSPLVESNNKAFIQRFKYQSKKVTEKTFSPHSLRHMYISYLVNYFPVSENQFGLPAAQAQKLVGHSSLLSTQKYIHPDIKMHQRQQKAFFDKNFNFKIEDLRG